MLKTVDFSLYLNDGIVIKRNFQLGNLNGKAIESWNFKETMDSIQDTIFKHLKTKSMQSSWSEYNPYLEEYPTTPRNIYEQEDIFRIDISVDDKVAYTTYFSGAVFHPGAKKGIDLREHWPVIFSQLRDVFTSKTKDLRLI